MFTATCTAKPRPMTQGSRSYMLKTGEAAWGRDVWHIMGGDKHTLCGRDASEWLTWESEEVSHDTCTRCAVKHGQATST